MVSKRPQVAAPGRVDKTSRWRTNTQRLSNINNAADIEIQRSPDTVPNSRHRYVNSYFGACYHESKNDILFWCHFFLPIVNIWFNLLRLPAVHIPRGNSSTASQVYLNQHQRATTSIPRRHDGLSRSLEGLESCVPEDEEVNCKSRNFYGFIITALW